MDITQLKNYSDANGNRIDYGGEPFSVKRIFFKGKNNILKIGAKANITHLVIMFNCNNGYVEIKNYGNIQVSIQIGEDSKVLIGEHVYFTAKSYMSAAEGTTISIGDTCMIASDVTFRTNDSHPIFYVDSGQRANPSKDVLIGKHVWICDRVRIEKGCIIESGSVIGAMSLVNGRIPNNCIAAGVPARVVKRDIAWEPPHLCYREPYYKPDASCVTKSKFWTKTID